MNWQLAYVFAAGIFARLRNRSRSISRRENERTIFIVGKASDEKWAGLRTTIVET
jgi:hypothetical protein